MHFLLKVPKILPIYYASRELVFKSIKEWLQPQDGDCSDVLILKRLPSASETLLPPPFQCQLCQHSGHTASSSHDQGCGCG